MSFFAALRPATAVCSLLLLAGAAGHALAAGPELATCGQRVSADEILRQINQARASAHRCGSRTMAAVPPLTWHPSLYAAAEGHSLDMARRNYFEHASPEGRTVRDRAGAQRYASKFVGENLAAGTRTLDEAMHMWLESAGHCENLMDPGFTEVALACVEQPGTQWGRYWTMVLGRR